VGNWLITIECCDNSSEHQLLICLTKKPSRSELLDSRRRTIANRSANLLQLLCIQLRTIISQCSHTKAAA